MGGCCCGGVAVTGCGMGAGEGGPVLLPSSSTKEVPIHRHRDMMVSAIWGTFWGPYYKGILLCGVYFRIPPIFVNPHMSQPASCGCEGDGGAKTSFAKPWGQTEQTAGSKLFYGGCQTPMAKSACS